MPSSQIAPEVDAVIVGAGFGGLYATHRLRNVLGLRVQSFEAGSGPGGTWYWNRYPGARCDIESITYSYSFDEDLQRDWRWTERFAAQPEILAYLEHVADRFDLLRSFEFDTRVTSVEWSETDQFWTVGTDTGRAVTARYVLAAPGGLSLAKENEIAGLEEFQGEIHRTSAWPHGGVDLAGKRVAVVGTGSTGIQIIPEIARSADHLTVFQRTPNFACPLGNGPFSDQEWDDTVKSYSATREQARRTFGGIPNPAPAAPSALMVDEESRRRVYDRYYHSGGFRMLTSTFGDLLFNKPANDTVADYIRSRIRDRVKDPEVARILCPGDDHPYGTKRAPFETEYYEAFNRDNVTLVDIRATPIETMTPTGLHTAAGDHDFDVLVLATGFDALTGPLIAMNVVGRGGVRLEDVWADGPRTYLGLAVPGFPNFFTIVGPQSPSVLTNFPVAIEEHVDYVGDVIGDMAERGAVSLEATEDAARTWTQLVGDIADCTLYPHARSSWYMGANVPGKARAVLLFVGGLPLYRAMCGEVAAGGYGGFSIDGAATPTPSILELEPAMALTVGGMLAADTRTLEELSLEELRAAMGAAAPLPPSDTVRTVVTSYPSADGDQPVRVYIPTGHEEELPVVVFFHPGGWISGTIEAVGQLSRSLAEELGAVVISPSYRLAPEHPFPAATDDALAAVRWAAATASEFGGDPHRIAVLGESSGGNLATVTAHRLRDEGGPVLAAQALVYPPIDPDSGTASRRRYRTGPILTTAALDKMWSLYLGDDPAARQSPLAVPSKAANLNGLPPTLVVTVEVDPVRDEAEAYGRQLADAGIPTEVVRIPGLAHAAFNMQAYVPRSAEIAQAVVTFLRANLATQHQDRADAVSM